MLKSVLDHRLRSQIVVFEIRTMLWTFVLLMVELNASSLFSHFIRIEVASELRSFGNSSPRQCAETKQNALFTLQE